MRLGGAGFHFGGTRKMGDTTQQIVGAESSGSKNQNDERCDQKDVGSGGRKLIWIREEGEERFAVGGDVGHDHVDGEDQSGHAREKTDGEKETAKKLYAGNEDGHLRGHGKIQAGKELRDFIEVMEFAPAAFDELPAPV